LAARRSDCQAFRAVTTAAARARLPRAAVTHAVRDVVRDTVRDAVPAGETNARSAVAAFAVE